MDEREREGGASLPGWVGGSSSFVHPVNSDEAARGRALLRNTLATTQGDVQTRTYVTYYACWA